MAAHSFIVNGRPVPAVRMTQRSKWTPQAQKYLAYKGLVGWSAKASGIKALVGPVRVSMTIYVGGRRGDIDNYVKAIFDGLKGIAWDDDRQVTCVSCRIQPVGSHVERVEVTVEEE